MRGSCAYLVVFWFCSGAGGWVVAGVRATPLPSPRLGDFGRADLVPGSVKPCTPSAQPASQPAPEQSGLEHGIPAERINPQR